jgi:hypothetical protein
VEEVRCLYGAASDRVNTRTSIGKSVARQVLTPACEYERWFSDNVSGDKRDKQILLRTLRELPFGQAH